MNSKQINFMLFLLALFICWLFLNSILIVRPRYVIFKSEDITSVMYDQVTGQTWRYFRNTDSKGHTISEGWTRLFYFGHGSIENREGYPMRLIGITPTIGKDDARIKGIEEVMERKKRAQEIIEEGAKRAGRLLEELGGKSKIKNEMQSE